MTKSHYHSIGGHQHHPKGTVFVVWIYTKIRGLEISDGKQHGRLFVKDNPIERENEEGNELARGKFDVDMKCGSIAFNTDDIRIQKTIAEELQSRYEDTVFYVFDQPNKYGGAGVLLEEFMGKS